MTYLFLSVEFLRLTCLALGKVKCWKKQIVKIKDLMIGLGRDLSNLYQKMMEY